MSLALVAGQFAKLICVMPDTEASTRAAGASMPVSVLLDWTLLILPGLIWGASFLFIAEGLDALAPDGVTFVRMLIGFLTLCFVPGARRPVERRDWPGIAWLGVLWFAFPMSIFPHAQLHVSSALTGMLNGVVPLISVVVAGFLARRVPSRGVLLGLAVGFAGAVLMGLPGVSAGGNEARSVLLIGVALASYGIAINVARPLQQRIGALPVVWRALAVAVVLTAPFGAPALLHPHWSLRSVLSLLALGVLGTALANIAMAVAAGRLGVTRATATTFLIPVVSLVLGVLVRGESVATLSLIGGIPCLAGAWLIRRASLRAHAKALQRT
jgi:drug/metabolite transporter (DMT)-like permease